MQRCGAWENGFRGARSDSGESEAGTGRPSPSAPPQPSKVRVFKWEESASSAIRLVNYTSCFSGVRYPICLYAAFVCCTVSFTGPRVFSPPFLLFFLSANVATSFAKTHPASLWLVEKLAWAKVTVTVFLNAFLLVRGGATHNDAKVTEILFFDLTKFDLLQNIETLHV